MVELSKDKKGKLRLKVSGHSYTLHCNNNKYYIMKEDKKVYYTADVKKQLKKLGGGSEFTNDVGNFFKGIGDATTGAVNATTGAVTGLFKGNYQNAALETTNPVSQNKKPEATRRQLVPVDLYEQHRPVPFGAHGGKTKSKKNQKIAGTGEENMTFGTTKGPEAYLVPTYTNTIPTVYAGTVLNIDGIDYSVIGIVSGIDKIRLVRVPDIIKTRKLYQVILSDGRIMFIYDDNNRLRELDTSTFGEDRKEIGYSQSSNYDIMMVDESVSVNTELTKKSNLENWKKLLR